MKKRLLALLLTGATLAATAAPTTYNFEFKNFSNDGTFSNYATVHGSFSGEDLNGDSVIANNELLSLTVGGYDYVHFPNGTADGQTVLGQLNSFSYKGGNALAFSVEYNVTENGVNLYREYYDFEREVTPFAGYGWALHDTWASSEWEVYDGYTKTTVWQIPTLPTVTAPVPEPSSIAMSLAGLGLMGLVARRRQRKSAR